MKNRLSGRLTRLHSGSQQKATSDLLKAIGLLFIIILFAFVVFAWLIEAGAEELEYRDIRKPENITQSIRKDAANSVKAFQMPDLKDAKRTSGEFQKPQRIEVSKTGSGGMVIENHAGQASPIQEEQGSFKAKGRLYYFLSFSMPPESIKQAMLDAVRLGKGNDLQITLVLRGLVNNDLKATFMAFYDLRQENGMGIEYPIELNPDSFTKYAVSRVPNIIFESEEKIGRISGAGIRYALSNFSAEIRDYGKQGDTYEIEEEDFIKFLTDRAKSPQVQKKIQNAFRKSMENMYRLRRYDGRFQKAVKDRVYRIDPTVTLTDDLLDHEGNVIFTKGSTFNPADYMTMTGKYIVIDGKDDKQMQLALKGNYRKIILASGDIMALNKKYKTTFYFINDILIDRFQLTHVPAILEQEGRYLRVTEKAVN
ncbi:MAG: TrbC family F-type conjugative pilus assembly protein [Nitrospirota bacterium]